MKRQKDAQDMRLSLIFFVCIIIGLFLRLWGIHFGLPFFAHSDEYKYLPLALIMLLSFDFNPHYFNNPPLLTYLYSLIMSFYFLLGKLVGSFASLKDFYESYLLNSTNFFVIARTTNALLSIGICLLVYQTGKRLFDKTIGTTAGILASFSFLLIRDSHYAVNDIPATFLMFLSFTFSASILTINRLKHYILSGLFVGMAVATKYNMGVVFFPLVMAHFFSVKNGRYINRKIVWGVVFCLVGFILFCPWLLLDFKIFSKHFFGQVMYGTSPWLGGSTTSSYIQYLTALLWGYGLIPFSFFIIGVVFLRREREKLFLLICFPLIYYLLLGGMELFFVRFAIPVIPFLCIVSAYGIISVVRRFEHVPAAIASGVLLILLSISQGLFFSYTHNHLISQLDTRIIARRWIKDNIPSKSPIVMEGYGPSLEVYDKKIFLQKNMNNYEVIKIGQKLSRIGLDTYKKENIKYIITSSYINKRFIDNPDKYPQETAFYRSLEEKARQVFKVSPSVEDVPFHLDDVYSPFWNLFRLERSGPAIKIFQIQE